MVSDTANRLLKRTDSEGSSSVAEKKSSAVPLFEAVADLWSAPDSLRERGDSQEGGNRRCLPSCAPARRQRTFPLDSSEKLSARQGRIADAARVPQLAFAKRVQPGQGEPPARFKCPGYPVPDNLTRKGTRFQDASALRRTVPPAHRV